MPGRRAFGRVWGLWGGSVFRSALAVLAPVLHEPEDLDATAALERVQRHLGRQELSLLCPAGELDRRALSVAKDAVEELAQLGQLGRVDVRDRRREQLLVCVAEHRAAGLVGGEDPVRARVDDVGRLARSLEE